MKSLILLMAMVTGFTASASVCTSYEAQVITKIESITKVQDVCFYKLKVLEINEHVFCPLLKSDIEQELVQFEAGYHNECPYRFDNHFTGILVKGSDNIINFD